MSKEAAVMKKSKTHFFRQVASMMRDFPWY
jgi:hypothetical protein